MGQRRSFVLLLGLVLLDQMMPPGLLLRWWRWRRRHLGGGHDSIPTPDLILEEGAVGRLIGGLQLRVLLLVVVVLLLEPDLPLVAERWRGVRRGLLRWRRGLRKESAAAVVVLFPEPPVPVG